MRRFASPRSLVYYGRRKGQALLRYNSPNKTNPTEGNAGVPQMLLTRSGYSRYLWCLVVVKVGPLLWANATHT